MSKKDNNDSQGDLLETVHEIRNSGNIAVDILSEMLDYDKIESRSMQLDLTTVAIKLFVLECIRPFYLQASSAGVELSLDFDDSVDFSDKIIQFWLFLTK
eukprot:gene12074-25315_t